MPTSQEREDWLKRLLVPTVPSAILLGLGAIDIAVQAKELSVKWKAEAKTTNPKLRELHRLEASSRFFEESVLDLLTLLAASIAINWLHRSGLKPLAWTCIVLPLGLISLTIVMHIARLRQEKRSPSKNHT